MKVVHACYLPVAVDHPDFGRIRLHPGRWVLNLALAQKAHTAIHPELVVQVPGSRRDFSTNVEGIPVHYLATPDRFRSATLFYFDAKSIGRKIHALKPDVVHGHGMEDAYAMATQRSGLPYVITAQGLHFLINRLVKPALISRERVVEFTERLCLEKARDVIAKSEYVALRLKEQFPHLEIHRIPNTLDPRLLEIREAKEWNVIAFVGAIIPRKGLDLLCDALETAHTKVPDLTLWIFGDNPKSPFDHEKVVKNRLRSLMGERVVFHGAKPTLEVARQLARAGALVAPSREEMFGNQLIEALTVGTHAIVTENTAMAENVERFGGGTIVPQEDPRTLAQAIVTVLQARVPSEIEEMRKRILDYMGPEVVARQHESLYGELLRKSF